MAIKRSRRSIHLTVARILRDVFLLTDDQIHGHHHPFLMECDFVKAAAARAKPQISYFDDDPHNSVNGSLRQYDNTRPDFVANMFELTKIPGHLLN